MSNSANLKIERAEKHIAELAVSMKARRPYSYVVGTNKDTRKRYTRARRNNDAVMQAALIAGDAVHALRSALDHIFWKKVSPFALSETEKKKVQFPFTKTEPDFLKVVQRRRQQGVPTNSCDVLTTLKAHEGPSGNQLLCLIHKLDIIDKHKTEIFMADYSQLTSDMLKSQIKDFPSWFHGSQFGSNKMGDIAWDLDVNDSESNLGQPIFVHGHYVIELEIDAPVEMVFQDYTQPIVPTLHKLVDLTRASVGALENA